MTDNELQLFLKRAIEKSSGPASPTIQEQEQRRLKKRLQYLKLGLGKASNICDKDIKDIEAFLDKMNAYAESLTTIKHGEAHNEHRINHCTNSG